MTFIPKFRQGHNAGNYVGGVMIFVLCTSSEGGLIIIPSFVKIFRLF